MAYDLHIVRTENWTEASRVPITKNDIEDLIADDSELAWSETDYIDMRDDTGAVTRYWMITWRDQPCFWWYRDEIRCSGPDEAQQLKLIEMAGTLNAYVVGDDGEIYDGDRGSSRRPTASLGERVAGWLARLRPQRRPEIEHHPLPFGVGDKVRDSWGNEHTVISINPKAEHGMGIIWTRRCDGADLAHMMFAHGLEPVAKK